MPTSTEKGFILSKWERNYLRCRYLAHRNKVADARPAIDSKAPPTRNHVIRNSKKALLEDTRQTQIIMENLRILEKTAEIMNTVHYTRSQSAPTTITVDPGATGILNYKKSDSITNLMKRNTRILFQWFILKFGKYIPWWAQINY